MVTDMLKGKFGEDYFNQIEVVPSGFKSWDIYMHSKKGLKYFVDNRTNKRNAKHVATGMAIAIGAGNKARGQELEVVIKDRKGRIKEKNSFGTDDPKIKG